MPEFTLSTFEQIVSDLAMNHSREFIDYCEEHWDELDEVSKTDEFQRLFSLRNSSSDMFRKIMDRKIAGLPPLRFWDDPA